jgi:hypothetical protein
MIDELVSVCLAKKFQTAVDARFVAKATDADALPRSPPVILRNQVLENRFQGDAMQRLLGWG